jgi:DNA repair exonuclease SbcCD ATPase subunit
MNNNELIKKCNTQTLIPSQSQKKEVFHLFGSNQTVTEFFYQLPEHLKVRLYEGHFRGQVEINNTNLVPIDSDVGKVINYLNNQQKQIMKKVSEGIDELQTELNHSRQENQKLKTEGEKIFKEFSSLEGKLQRKNQLLRNTNVKFEQLSQTLEENISTGLQRIELLSSASDNQNDLAIKLRLAEFEAFKYCSRNHLLEQNVENLKMLLNEEQENLALFQNKYNRDVKKLQFDIKSLENDKKMFEKINQRLEKEKNETFTKYKESEKKYQSLLIK